MATDNNIKPKTYADVLKLLQESGDNRLSVAVIYKKGHFEWLPVDKAQYIYQLSLISNAADVLYPCWLETDPDGEMFIHSRVANGQTPEA